MANIMVGWGPQRMATTGIRRRIEKGYEANRTLPMSNVLKAPLDSAPLEREDPSLATKPPLPFQSIWDAEAPVEIDNGPPGAEQGDLPAGYSISPENASIIGMPAFASSNPTIGQTAQTFGSILGMAAPPLGGIASMIGRGLFGAVKGFMNPQQTQTIIESWDNPVGDVTPSPGQMGDPAAAALGVSPGQADPATGTGVVGGAPGGGEGTGPGGGGVGQGVGVGAAAASAGPGASAGIGGASADGGGGCIIVTACTSRDAPEVQIAREYRDKFLDAETLEGYYVIAGLVVPVIKSFVLFKWVAKILLVNRLVDYGAYMMGSRGQMKYRTSEFVTKKFLSLCRKAGKATRWAIIASRYHGDDQIPAA